MYIQGKYLTGFFAKVTKIPSEILIPIIVVFCFAGSYSIKSSMFDLYISIAFGIIAYILVKLKFSTIPVLLGLVLGALTESNLRRTLIISQGSLSIFYKRPISLVFIIVLAITIGFIVKENIVRSRKGLN